MPTVWIPPLMRSLTNNQEIVTVPGETIREVIDNLETEYPGLKDRLLEDGRIRPGLSVAVDGVIGENKLRQRVNEDSEIHFIPAMSGGA